MFICFWRLSPLQRFHISVGGIFLVFLACLQLEAVDYASRHDCPICRITFSAIAENQKPKELALDGKPMSAGFLSPPECPLCGGVFVDADVASFAPKLLESVIWGQDYQQARKNDAWARYAMILEKLQLDRCRVAQAYLHAAWAAESKELCGKYLQQSLQAFMDFYESPGFADLSADEAQTIILRISEVNRQLGRFADAIAWAKKMLLHPEFGKGWSGTLLRQSLALAAAENMQPAVAQSQTRLHLAVAEGNDKQLQELLCDDSHLVDEVDRNGMTALMLALQLGRSQAAARILSAGARVDVTDDSGNNALYYAVDGGSLVLAKAVLQRLPAPDSLNGSGVSALHHAVVKNNAAMAKLLLQSGMSPAVRDGNGNSLLHLLAGTASPSMDLAKLLLEVVSDPNQRNFADRTPLHIAVEKGHADLTKLLLKHGASINARTPDGCSSLFFCDADLIGLLIESGADYRLINNQGLSAFAVARIEGNRERIAEFKKTGLFGVPAKKFSIDGRDITIFSAIRAGDMSAVQKILQTDRLQADACDEPLGESPLHLAVSLEKHDLAVLLIDHGAKVNAITDFQRTPLHYAASSGNLEIVKLLCRNGADIFALDIRGSTPLHDAAATQNLRVYNYIESLGASDSTVDNSGQPASALIELK